MSLDVLHQNYVAGKKSLIIPLTFPDLSGATHLLQRIGYGGDCWELRVDLLNPSKGPLGETNLPDKTFVANQLALLQTHSNLPVLYTIRTLSQGGKFPDDAHEEALELMLLAVEKGCEYIDVEIEWPTSLVTEVTRRKSRSKVVASYHSWTGEMRWTSQTLKEKYEFADTVGDIIKLSILSRDLYDCHELSLFIRSHDERSPKPLLAVGMGANGQLSRITSPISLVTHSLIPFPSAPGQLTMAELFQAWHLMGQLPRRQYFGINSSSASEKMFQLGFKEIGYPHRYNIKTSSNIVASLTTLLTDPKFGGVSFPLTTGLEKLVEHVSATSKSSGMIDTIFRTSDKDGRRYLAGDNTQMIAFRKCIQQVSMSAKGCTNIILGSGPASDAAFVALSGLGLKGTVVQELASFKDPVLVINTSPDGGHYPVLPTGSAVVSWTDVQSAQIFAQFELWTGRPAPESIMMD